jgi:hypothetical protein
MFLAPGARLDPGWQASVKAFLDDAIESGGGRRRAACFRLSLVEPGMRARASELVAAIRSRLLAAPLDEQGLLVPKALYRSLGGHRDLPAVAGIDLTRRIGRRRLTLLHARAIVRMPREGEPSLTGSLRIAACLALFVLRLPPRLIGRLAA